MRTAAHKVAFQLRLSLLLAATLFVATNPAFTEPARPTTAAARKAQTAKKPDDATQRKKPGASAPGNKAPNTSVVQPPARPEQKPAAKAPPPDLPPSPQTPLEPVDTSIPPPSLPHASREKMRACAEEWEKKKLATKSGLPMWRSFATQCLTR